MSSENKFAITRRIEIDAAHRVPHHGSKCFKVHGHRYRIEATCSGNTITEGEQTGMVMDFGFLKECMMDTIHANCDHGIILWKNDPLFDQIVDSGVAPWWKLHIIDYVPTAENLAMLWFYELQDQIDRWFEANEPELASPSLDLVEVHETPNCVAAYPWD